MVWSGMVWASDRARPETGADPRVGYRSGARRTRAWERGCGTKTRPHFGEHFRTPKCHRSCHRAKLVPPLKGVARLAQSTVGTSSCQMAQPEHTPYQQV